MALMLGSKSDEVFGDFLQQLINNSEKILDVGTSQRFAKELRPYESWFKQKEYIASGYNPAQIYGEYNCDCHQDIESMTFEDNYFDGVICLEVLEHVQNPFKAASELKRVLKPQGLLLVTVPFLVQYHGKGSTSQGHDSYPDYWRFTHEGLQSLFSDFTTIDVLPLNGPIEFRLNQFSFSRYLLKNLSFQKLMDLFDKPKIGKSTTRHLLFGIK